MPHRTPDQILRSPKKPPLPRRRSTSERIQSGQVAQLSGREPLSPSATMELATRSFPGIPDVGGTRRAEVVLDFTRAQKRIIKNELTEDQKAFLDAKGFSAIPRPGRPAPRANASAIGRDSLGNPSRSRVDFSFGRFESKDIRDAVARHEIAHQLTNVSGPSNLEPGSVQHQQMMLVGGHTPVGDSTFGQNWFRKFEEVSRDIRKEPLKDITSNAPQRTAPSPRTPDQAIRASGGVPDPTRPKPVDSRPQSTANLRTILNMNI